MEKRFQTRIFSEGNRTKRKLQGWRQLSVEEAESWRQKV
jgi:hypothetical protein